MRSQVPKTIIYPLRCPDCGKFKKPIFYRDTDKTNNNIHCNCQNKRNGLGFDLSLKVRNIDEQPILYAILTSSGIENIWQKNHLRCPICGQPQFQFHSGDSGKNHHCINPNCPAIGYDYERSGNRAMVTASGILNDIQQFLNKTYEQLKISTRIPIDRSNKMI